jgi:hypothetical protein
MGEERAMDTTQVITIVTYIRREFWCLAYCIGFVTAMYLCKEHTQVTETYTRVSLVRNRNALLPLAGTGCYVMPSHTHLSTLMAARLIMEAVQQSTSNAIHMSHTTSPSNHSPVACDTYMESYYLKITWDNCS